MSILVNQFYANNVTPVWLPAGAPNNYSAMELGTAVGTVANTYDISGNGGGPVVTLSSADTSGCAVGGSYLCVYCFSCAVSIDGELPATSATTPLYFQLSFTGTGATFTSGCEYYFDSTQTTNAQTGALCISLPFVYSGTGGGINFGVNNPSLVNFAVTMTTLSEAIICSSYSPTVVDQIFIPS